MQPLIDPVERELLRAELTEERLLRKTNNASNEIYVVNAHNSPNTMQEIGRLRELSFRQAGGGTGVEVDIDELDLVEGGYNQLIVWDPVAEQIVGGYRFSIPRNKDTKLLSTEHYFSFSQRFREEFLPYTIELGRSFVQPNYQSMSRSPKSIYSLDNLWDGLGALMLYNEDMRYFLGKVTMYGDYNKQARDLLLYFLKKYFPDHDNLLVPISPIVLNLDQEKYSAIFTGGDYAEDYKILTKNIRILNENIPPLINSYMNLSPSMRVFGTVCNHDFGDVEETGILITIEDIYPKKTERHTKDLLDSLHHKVAKLCK